MKRFRDLTVFVEPEALDPLISAIESRLADGWSRNAEHDEEMRGLSGGPAFCFVRNATADLPAVALVMGLDGNRLEANNIVPHGERLSIDEYNSILIEFFLKFLHEPASEAGLFVELSPDERTIENTLGSRAMELLRRFSNCANKSSSHPADERRWIEFLIYLHLQPRAHRSYDDVLVGKWLSDDGWREDKVERFTSELEFAGEMLRVLEKEELLAPWARKILGLADPPGQSRETAPNQTSELASKQAEESSKARSFQPTIVKRLFTLLAVVASYREKLRKTATARALP
jgi:hypothetical protein